MIFNTLLLIKSLKEKIIAQKNVLFEIIKRNINNKNLDEKLMPTIYLCSKLLSNEDCIQDFVNKYKLLPEVFDKLNENNESKTEYEFMLIKILQIDISK